MQLPLECGKCSLLYFTIPDKGLILLCAIIKHSRKQRRGVERSVKALANEDTLLPTQMFPRLPARVTFVADTNFVSGTQKMFLILFRNILCPQQMFPSLSSPRNIMGNNVSATIGSLSTDVFEPRTSTGSRDLSSLMRISPFSFQKLKLELCSSLVGHENVLKAKT